MAKSKEEQIFIGIDHQIIELTGADKEAYLQQRLLDQAEEQALSVKQEEQNALKVSAYTKLGLTKEEINAIL
jgi:hypothetical protein